MGELASTLVSLSGPDAVHGIIPEALVRYERDPQYTSTVKSASPAPPPAAAVNGDGPAHTNGTTPAPTKKDEDALPVPAESRFGRTTVVKDMHTRKQMMAQEVLAGGPGSGFIALSGGYGTIEELVEICTWNQLGIHDKGVCVLNINGFYDGLLGWIRRSIEEGFIRQGNGEILKEATTPEDAIKALREYKVSQHVLKLSWGDMK
jgi:predicted Rossmann-fold nucleotide-binding protein